LAAPPGPAACAITSGAVDNPYSAINTTAIFFMILPLFEFLHDANIHEIYDNARHYCHFQQSFIFNMRSFPRTP
jgi:hypothetical protein